MRHVIVRPTRTLRLQLVTMAMMLMLLDDRFANMNQSRFRFFMVRRFLVAGTTYRLSRMAERSLFRTRRLPGLAASGFFVRGARYGHVRRRGEQGPAHCGRGHVQVMAAMDWLHLESWRGDAALVIIAIRATSILIMRSCFLWLWLVNQRTGSGSTPGREITQPLHDVSNGKQREVHKKCRNFSPEGIRKI